MTKCFYRVDGEPDDAPVVLLHAIATDSDLWAPQIPVWASAFRVIRIDLPGHGASPAPLSMPNLDSYADCIVAVLDELGVEAVSVVGLSFGGMVAQALALKYPSRVRSLVLAHTSARTEAPVREIWDSRITQFQKEGMESQVAPTLERWFTRAFSVASPLTLEWLARIIERTTDKGYVAAIRAIQGLDHLDRLPEISVKALIIAGEADSAVPPAAAAAIAEKMTNARLLVLKEAAHLGNLEQPVAFTEAVGAFLREASARE